MSNTPDLSEFLALSRPKRQPCQIAGARDKLDNDEQAAQLDAALATDKGIIPGPAIRQWLAARGLDVSESAVSSHRRGVCACGRA